MVFSSQKLLLYSDWPWCYNCWTNLLYGGYRKIWTPRGLFLPDATEICAPNQAGTGDIAVWIRQTGTSSGFLLHLSSPCVNEASTSICFYILGFSAVKKTPLAEQPSTICRLRLHKNHHRENTNDSVINGETQVCLCLCVLVLGRWADRGTKGHECGLLQIWLAALIRPQLWAELWNE